ncbi:MAG: hypothetical protein HYR55_20725 [Acidobacteria bacterium]|nr:hypothetical protein [Acidobacteriota bacterium]MBI3657913.1 hypothetical protein [Acidobacteriota bacterium]
MDNSIYLAGWLIVWLGAILAALLFRWRGRPAGSGLLLAYLFHLSLIHWVATCIYLAQYAYYERAVIEIGFRQSAYAVLAFAFGSVILTPVVLALRRERGPGAVKYHPHPSLPKAYIIAGMASYLLSSSVLGRLPSATALVSIGQYLFVIGVCLSCWQAWLQRSTIRFLGWLLAALLLPFVTILSQGFIGYGTVAATVVFAFGAGLIRPRWKVVVAGLLMGYLGLSFYVGYMRDRGEIREMVWGGQPVWDRVERVYRTLRTVEWFDWSDETHLRAIDERLNQNFFVGTAVRRLSTSGDYAYGETLWQGVMALVPRVLWPEKPVFAGSPGLVTAYTGIRFAPGTSVGIGQVMEFYINFGTLGVVLGFLVLGVLITVIDITAGARLRQGDWQGFALWYLMGISFLQVGGSLVEITSTAAAGVVAAWLVNKGLLLRYQKKQPTLKRQWAPSSIQ